MSADTTTHHHHSRQSRTFWGLRPRSWSSKLALLTLAACCSWLLSGSARNFTPKLNFNHTPSLPIGFYREVPASDLISFCLTKPWSVMATARSYRTAANINGCPDGGEPLLKKIVARPGDLVTETRDAVAVNGVLLPHSKPLPLDSGRRVLEPFTVGSYQIKSDELWVMGSSPKSFDSRYYGPIKTSAIRAHWEASFVWN